MEGDDLAGGFFTCYQGEGGLVEASSEVAVMRRGLVLHLMWWMCVDGLYFDRRDERGFATYEGLLTCRCN